MSNRPILIIAFLLGSFAVRSQNTFTLQQAVETGIRNNLDVQQSDVQMQKSGISWKQSRANMLPTLNASADHGINYGRSIDPFTNAFIDQKVGYASYGASSGLVLFNGFSLQNDVQANRLGYQASREEWQQAKDNLTINIILAYLQVLRSKDLLQQVQEQVEVSRKQTDRLAILNEKGNILPSDYYDLKGQLASDQLNIADSKAALESAKLSLAQLLNIPYTKELDVEPLTAESFSPEYQDAPDKIYEEALQHFAQVKAASLRTQSAEKNVKSLKGQLFPTLSLGGNVNTNYSSVATRDYFLNSTEVASSNYVNVDGSQYPVMVKQNNYDTRKISYGDQLNNNLFYTINLGLRVPLFNASRVRSQVKMATLDLKATELKEKSVRTQLQQAIEQAYVNLTAASEKYRLLQDQVTSFEESFRTAEIRFNAGSITSVDYLVAKNNLDRSKSNLITSRYDFVLRQKILDYYGGKALW